MINFYNAADNALYKRPDSQFITQERFRGNVAPNPGEIEEENVTETFGIPNTKTFQSMNNGGNNFNYNNSFKPYTANTNYISNRSNYGNSGYLPGAEPEETYMDKIGGYIKTGIGAMIPGGNFLMGMAGKLDNFKNLSGTDKAFIEMQMANQEQSMYGGNLTNQDRYGYNKRSAKGNYNNVIADRVAIANQRIKDNKELRDIDNYYLEKEEEKKYITNQMTQNDLIRQSVIANRLRQSSYVPVGPNSEGITPPDTTKTTNNNNGGGGDDAPPGFGKTDAGNYTNQFEGGDPGQNQGTESQAGGFTAQDDARESYSRYKNGGRIGYYFGGLAARGMKK